MHTDKPSGTYAYSGCHSARALLGPLPLCALAGTNCAYCTFYQAGWIGFPL